MTITKGTEKALVVWFGIVQSLHLVVLARALIIFSRTAKLPFPALPPPQGWSPQAEHFLTGNGIIDAFNIFLSLIFIYGYFKSKSWALKTGLIALTILLYSALIFSYVTINAGAWSAHPYAYGSMVVLYLPIFILTIHFFLNKDIY
ncbi:MAG: hypothetical protein ACP5FZ_01645, partial [Fidelibacterota bacterium]